MTVTEAAVDAVDDSRGGYIGTIVLSSVGLRNCRQSEVEDESLESVWYVDAVGVLLK